MRRSLVAVAIAGIAGCSLPDGDYFGRIPDPIDATEFRWCSQGEPDHLDPTLAWSTASLQLVLSLFDGLTVHGPEGLPVPGLATHWEISDDLRRFTFHLRRDARWSNGRPLTAYDVASSALRVANPLTASPNADQLAPIRGATAYLERRALVLRRAVGPYRAGEIVEAVGAAAADRVAELTARTGARPLALRDLGAAPDTAYAVVPPGARVTLMMTSGGRATLPSPDGDDAGAAWAYVTWPRDQEGVAGWVPAAELDGEPAADTALQIRAGDRPTVTARGRDVVYSTDAIGIAVADPYTIEFETADPTPYFIASTAHPALRATPIEAWSRWPRSWDRPEHIITSGPFHLVAWRERDAIEMVRSPTYRDRAAIRIERFTSLSMTDQAAATNAYFTGACDATAANVVPSSYLPAINGELRGGRAYKDYDASPFFGVYFLWLQTQKLPNRHLRRALSLAIDRTAVPRIVHGGEIPTAQLTPGTPIARLAPADLAACGVERSAPGVALVMSPGELCYVPPPGLDYDLAAARRELALARAEGGVPDRPIEYRYNAGSEGHKQIAEYVQAAWAKIGVSAALVGQEWNSLLDDTARGEFEIARFGNVGTTVDTESEFLVLLRCASPFNRGRYCSPEFERLMAEAHGIADRARRNAVLRRAEAEALGDAPLIPLYVLTQKHLIKPYVRDYAINLLDLPPLQRVWIDPAWRPR